MATKSNAHNACERCGGPAESYFCPPCLAERDRDRIARRCAWLAKGIGVVSNPENRTLPGFGTAEDLSIYLFTGGYDRGYADDAPPRECTSAVFKSPAGSRVVITAA
jgi:hypothetical protein